MEVNCLALQNANLRVDRAIYQDPAVISTKSQMALEGSYVGDFYVTFKKSKSKILKFEDVRDSFALMLTNAATLRGGKISKGLAFRFALQKWLNLNVDANEIHELEDLLKNLFDASESKLIIKNSAPNLGSLELMISQTLADLNLDREKDLQVLSERLITEYSDYGIPSMSEVMTIADKLPRQDQLL